MKRERLWRSKRDAEGNVLRLRCSPGSPRLETAFHESDVQRIDIGEPRATLPLVISDKARFPGCLRARPAGYPRWQPAAHRALSFSATAAERRVDIAEKARPGGEATGSASPSSERGKQGGAPQVFVSEIGVESRDGSFLVHSH